ncbi:MAG: hypothetical protein BroJett029_15450 [Alphaproteobacteria bacterium]|nr:MAG: hypothetical protein BroJett029_15450 [Alphaproteobacteria bacterium]
MTVIERVVLEYIGHLPGWVPLPEGSGSGLALILARVPARGHGGRSQPEDLPWRRFVPCRRPGASGRKRKRRRVAPAPLPHHAVITSVTGG